MLSESHAYISPFLNEKVLKPLHEGASQLSTCWWLQGFKFLVSDVGPRPFEEVCSVFTFTFGGRRTSGFHPFGSLYIGLGVKQTTL